MRLVKILLTAVAALCLSACLHISEKIEELPLRAEKSQILKRLGKPFKIKRKGGKDYWIYRFVIEGRHYTQAIVLKDGQLNEKKGLKPYSLKYW